MYRYFVCFNHSGEGGTGFGNTELSVNKIIDGIEDIIKIANFIEIEGGYKHGTIVIVNYKLF